MFTTRLSDTQMAAIRICQVSFFPFLEYAFGVCRIAVGGLTTGNMIDGVFAFLRGFIAISVH